MSADGNAMTDPSGTTFVAWLVLVAPVLVLVAIACVRRVGPGEVVLVVRGSHVVRVGRRGHVARWPGLERFEHWTLGRQVMPLVVRAPTRDRVDVIALADLVVDVADAATGVPYVPLAQVARRAEDLVAEGVAQAPVCALVDELAQLEVRWLADVRRMLPAGMTACELSVTEVEAQLTPRVAEAIRHADRAGGDR